MSGDQRVEVALHAIAAQLEERVDQLAEEMLARARSEVFDGFDHPELDAAYLRNCRANVRNGLSSLRDGDPRSAVPPAEAESGARSAARVGLGLSRLLQTYRIGHAVTWEHVLALVHDLELDDATRSETLRLASRFLFAHDDAILPRITDAYSEEREALLRSGEHRRRRLLDELLDGRRAEADELGYNVRGDHLGVVAWGARPQDALTALAQLLTGSSLRIAADDVIVWAWLKVGPDAAGWRRRVSRFAAPERTSIALGTVAAGVEGFRRTHREAQRAAVVGRHRRAPVTCFADVVVEALALHDELAARELVARELGPLAAADARSATLRDTLRAYLETSSNASAAAALLDVNDRTVAYRLRGIEDLLGYPVSTRSLELRIALRCEALLVESTRG